MRKSFFVLAFCFLTSCVSAINDSLRFAYCIETYDGSNGRMPSYRKSIQVLDSLGRVILSEEYLREGETLNGTSFNIADSIFRITSRDIYEYDSLSHLISDTHTYYSSTDSIVREFLYRYDIFGKKIATQNYQLYPAPVVLLAFDSTAYSGDSTSYYLKMQWNGVSIDTSDYYLTTYDTLNRKIFELKYEYNGSFYGITNTYWSYLVSGEIDRIITRGYYGDSTRVTYSYNAFNNILSTLSETYNSDSSGWVSPIKLDYIYDTNNFLFRIIYVPCLTPACLDTIIKKELNYDSLGRLTRLLFSNFDGQPFRLYTYTYDANGDTIFQGYMYDDGGPCGAGRDEYYFYNSDHTVVHTHNESYSGCGNHTSDCYIYDLGADSMVVDISYPLIACSNETIYPVVFSAGGLSPHTYTWSPGIQFSDSTIEQPNLLINTSYIYNLNVTDSAGRIASDTMSIVVTTPHPNLGPDTTICINSVIVLDPGPFYGYDWSDDDWYNTATVTSAVDDSILVFVTVSDQYNCIGTDSVLIVFDACTGISEIENASDVFPNPFHDKIIIVNNDNNSLCRIYAVDGKLIKSYNLQSGKNVIETSDFPAGIYVLVVNDYKNSQFNFLVKE